MREIKFRAWTGEEMVQPDYNGDYWVMTFRDGSPCLLEGYELESGPYDLDYMPIDATFLQFTGLKDRNGKEIYEGDILDEGGDNQVVFWCEVDGAWVLGNSPSDDEYYWITARLLGSAVIGNIYENPELLEGKQ